jgi:transposase
MGRVRNQHSREFKLEAVRALRSGQHTASELARRLGVTELPLRDWDKEYEKYKEEAFPDQGRRSGQAAEIARLKRELEQVKEERDILKKSDRLPRERVTVRYRFIRELWSWHSVATSSIASSR